MSEKNAVIETSDALVLDTAHIWHGILYGDAGVGKSTAFASMASKERPITVAIFDALGKDIPYHLRGRADATLLPDQFEDKWGTRYREVRDSAGNLLVRIEYYHDARYDAPEAVGRFRERINRLAREYARGAMWGFILDSATSAALRFRKYDEYVENVGARNTMQHYGAETSEIENVVLLHLPQLPCTVGVAMHVSKTKVEAEGTMVRAPAVRGRNQENLATQWPEIYRVWVDKGEDGKKVRRYQTENDERWLATTVLGVPDGAVAGWKAIAKAF